MPNQLTDTQRSATREELEALFTLAIDLPPDQREQVLAERCAHDPSLLTRVSTLLAAHDANSDGRIAALPVRSASEEVPHSIGSYDVLRLVAEGSIGAVYEGMHQVTARRAALKLLRGGFATARLKLRFQLEAETLGKLNHPGIAHLYEAGVTEITLPGGTTVRRPFIAMEFVEGSPISTFVSSRQLSPRQCVVLIRDAARAVFHAHQRGIVHRDLKPANILVSSEGVVKVVDFGIARLVETAENAGGSVPPAERGSLTMDGVVVGTPNFMSPEQLAGNPDEVDLPADVYGLGATLYLVLTGTAPHGDTTLLSLAAVARLLTAEIPDVRTRRLASQKSNHSLGTETVDADLAAVVHRALDRNVKNRYPDAAHFADDLDNWLAGRPTVARPLGTFGRAAKFVRRNRWRSAALALAAVAFFSIPIGLAIAARALLQERHALSQQQAAVNFMNDMLFRISPDAANPLSGDQKLTDLVEQAQRDIHKLKSTPEVEAAVRITLARINLSLGRLDLAEENASTAAALSKPEALTQIQAEEVLAASYKERSRLFDVVPLRKHIFEWRNANQGPNHPDTLHASAELSFAILHAEAPVAHRFIIDTVSLLERRRDELKREGQWTPEYEAHLIRARELVAIIHIEHVDFPSRIAGQLETAISESTTLNGANHPITIRLERIRGIGLFRRGDFAQARQVLGSVRDRLAPRIGIDNPTTLLLDNYLANIEAEIGNLQSALEQHRNLLPRLQNALGPRHYKVVGLKMGIASDLRRGGKLDEAEALLAECKSDLSRVDGPTAYSLRVLSRELALLYEVRGQYQQAIEMFGTPEMYVTQKAIAKSDKPLTDVGAEFAIWYMDAARLLNKTGQHNRAKNLAIAAHRSLVLLYGPDCGHSRAAAKLVEQLHSTP